MGENIFVIIEPTEEQQRIIEDLIDYLVRSRFKELYLPEALSDPMLSTETKKTLETWFQMRHSLVLLDHLTFHRCGTQWAYEIHSVESPLVMAEAVLFWLQVEYPRNTTIHHPDRMFLRSVFEIYQDIITDRLVEDKVMDRGEASEIRSMLEEDFFELMDHQLQVGPCLPYLQVDPATIARIIDGIKKYELMKALAE